jgi:heme/copper-type cytochrome/quinol oxidase subunit 2
MILVIAPVYVIMFIKMFSAGSANNPAEMMSSLSMMGWVTPIYMIVSLVVSLIFTTVSSVNYYSLVEGKEGLGEKEAINSIGL